MKQDASGVRVTVKDVDTHEHRELHAKYLIAADGGHSKVREALGIGYDGRGVFSNSLTIYFHADLSPWLGDKAWSIIYVNNEKLGGFFRMNRAGNAGFLAINTVGDPNVDPVVASNVAFDVSEAAAHRVGARRRGRAGSRREDRWLHAVARYGRCREPLSGRARIYLRRRCASHASQRRVRWQHRDS